jgi:hypothetical protein
MEDINSLATCESCGRLLKERTKHFYCRICDRYYFICKECEEYRPHCRFCGASLLKHTEVKKRVTPRRKPAGE